MSGGLTSYPRTGGNGGGRSHLSTIRQAIAQLSLGTVSSNATTAQLIIDSLRAYAGNTRHPPSATDIIAVALSARNALFAAQCNGLLLNNRFQVSAMEICATHWKSQNPLQGTALNGRVMAADNDLKVAQASMATATTKRDYDLAANKVRMAMEEIGMVGWLYEASALAGEDLGATLMNNASKFVDDERYRGGFYGKKELEYLECGGAYNVNVMLRISIPGTTEKLLIAGEAKGGASGYGKVGGPPGLLASWGVQQLSQSDIRYAASRAYYMERTKKVSESQKARKQAGELITLAYANGRLFYLTARTDAHHASNKEIFTCQ
ncbi:hypothetical protein [uncultured Pseudomonas sp.]|uniref:hypothetical protein n=1 Tax=uncultured Pseudomonas sp. TaxID=114707 RepID=UPI0025FC6F4C|nr:hypothetical protein [uncultured Pseudomonas sp.]